MNRFSIGLIVIVAITVCALRGESLIFQSDLPLPAGLAVAVEREMIASEASQYSPSAVVVRIHGVCSVPGPLRQSDPERPLGWVESVDGQILSIIHVDCLRIGKALWRIVTNPRSAETLAVFARAIARVIRHELRHVLLNTSDHEKSGENKAALRAEELAASSPALSPQASRLHPSRSYPLVRF